MSVILKLKEMASNAIPQWSLAVWTEDDVEEEGVVPSTWIANNTVRWPKGVNAIRAMKERRQPDERWDSFPLIKVKCRSDDKQACEEFNQTTTVETSEEEEEEKIRKRIPKKKTMEDFLFGHNLRGEEENQSGGRSSLVERDDQNEKQPKRGAVAQLPKPPQKFRSGERDSGKTKYIKPTGQRLTSLPVRRRSPSPVQSWRSRSPSPETDRGSSVASSSRRSRSRSPKPSCSSDVFPMTTARFQKRVLFLLTAIRNAVTRTAASQSQFQEGMKITRLMTCDELLEFDDKLKDPDAFESLKVSLNVIGGVSAADHTKRAMEKMLHNSLMAKLNLSGKRGKYPFKDTRIFSAIFDAVRASHPGTTESAFLEVVQKYLKYAPERAGGGGRKDHQ